MLNISKAVGIDGQKTKPLLNTFYNQNRNGKNYGLSATQHLQQKKQLMEWFKTRPELNSPVFTRVNDTITDVEFFSVDGRPLGRNKRMRAQSFWRDNFMDERLKSIWIDAVCTGDGFGWVSGLSKEQVMETFKTVAGSFKAISGVDYKELKRELESKAIDEDLRSPRVFDYVASSTMEVTHNQSDVTGYTQYVNTNKRDYKTSEIIHFTFSRIDGKVNGYTPVFSLARELILIWFIKENMLSYMRNNGVPKKIFSLKEELANSDNHKFLMEQLSSFHTVQSRHGNLVIAGDVDVTDLEEKLRDMEYEQLAKYVTNNIAYALGIPNSRNPYNLDGKASSDAGGLTEQGYWKLIESDRKKIENLLNTQVFNKMGVMVRFVKSHRIDTLREVQAWSMKADAITKLDSILNKFGKRLTHSKMLSLMELGDEDVIDAKPEDMVSADNTGLRNQNLLNNQELARGDKGLAKSEAARTAAVNNPKGVPQDGN